MRTFANRVCSGYVHPDGSRGRPHDPQDGGSQNFDRRSRPKLIKSARIDAETFSVGGERPAIVSMVVDEAGKPTALKIVQSSNEASDKNVLAAVSQFRYVPGTVSGQVVDVPVNLVLTIQK